MIFNLLKIYLLNHHLSVLFLYSQPSACSYWPTTMYSDAQRVSLIDLKITICLIGFIHLYLEYPLSIVSNYHQCYDFRWVCNTDKAAVFIRKLVSSQPIFNFPSHCSIIPRAIYQLRLIIETRFIWKHFTLLEFWRRVTFSHFLDV